MNAVMNLGRLLRLKIKVAHNVLDTAHIGRTVLLSSTVHNNTSSLDLFCSKR